MIYVETIPFLLINSYWDLKYKRVIAWMTIAWAGIGIGMKIAMAIISQEFLIEEWVGTLIALGILAICHFSHEKIGYGDGITILALSVYMDTWGLLEVLFVSTFILAIVAVILLGLFHKKKSYEIPFIPFLLLGTLCHFVGGALS